jgi:hypothetical protein
MAQTRYRNLGRSWEDKRCLSFEQFSSIKQDAEKYRPSPIMLHNMAIGYTCAAMGIKDMYVRVCCSIIPLLFELEAIHGVGYICEKSVRTLTGVFEGVRVSEINNLKKNGYIVPISQPAMYKATYYQLTELAKRFHHIYISTHGNLLADINMRLSTTKR